MKLPKIFNRKQTISTPLTYPLITKTGQIATSDRAFKLTAVYTCIKTISESIAQLPINVYETTKTGEESINKTLPAAKLLARNVNPEQSTYSFRENLIIHLLLHGNAYIYLEKTRSQTLNALYLLNPTRVTIYRDTDTNQKTYQYTKNEEANQPKYKQNQTETIEYKHEEIIHIAINDIYTAIGVSPLRIVAETIGLSISAEEFAQRYFRNSIIPSGIIESPTLIKNKDEVRQQWNKGFSNSNRHSIAILENGQKFTPLSVDYEKSQILETRLYQLREIARIFRIPPHMIGDLERSTFSNIEHQALEFVKYTLQPYISKLERALSYGIFGNDLNFSIRFNVDGLLRGDYATRMQGYATGIQNGFLSPNDVRKLEHLNPIPDEEGGNYYIVNGNMKKLTDTNLNEGENDAN